MTDKEVFSVVIPVRNRPQLVIRTLESVKAQTYRPIHIIVVDNNSTDNTPKAVETWAKRNCGNELSLQIFSEPKPGAAAARNRGLKSVKSEWMLFFDSDDEMKPQLVERIMSAVSSNPSAEMIYWKCRLANPSFNSPSKKFNTNRHWHSHIYNAQFCTLSYAVRTTLFQKTNGWNESLLAWDDWELGIRILLADPERIGIPEVLTVIHPQNESITGTNHYSKAGSWEEAIDTSENTIRQSDLDSGIKAKLLDMINYRRVNLAALYKREKHPELAHPLLEKAKSKNKGTLKWLWLKILYFYTAIGGRGAYLLWW